MKDVWPWVRSSDHDISARAASKLGAVFHALIERGETRARAQRFALQCAVILFLEDCGVLTNAPFHELVESHARARRSADIIREFFHRLNEIQFPIGLLATIENVDLAERELSLLAEAATTKWSRIHPGIFGTLFQATMNATERHERGAHYTPEAAIYEHVVRPTLVAPWVTRIREASTRNELLAAHDALTNIRILDPACGSGNFLHVAYCALKRLEIELLTKLRARFPAAKPQGSAKSIRTQQLFGIDTDPFAVELAKVTLMLGKKRTLDEISEVFGLENLDDNIRCDDALFCVWPKADYIIGNPPFQSKNKMQREFGPDYVRRLRKRYADVPGRADYCVYWFRRAHDELAKGASAGLVGTNTIRQNYSREGGLDYIVKHGGTITEAVSTMVWPGEAIVHVSVVNWVKGIAHGPKKLSWQEGDGIDSPWKESQLDNIPSSLSTNVDVTQAKSLRANAEAGVCYQGQTHGHEGFLLSEAEARHMLSISTTNRDVLFPYLIGDDLLSNMHGQPSRWVIDFSPRQKLEAQQYTLPFQRIENLVLTDREAAASAEDTRNERLDEKGNKHHAYFLKRWWLLSYPRTELMTKLQTLSRYIACSRVTKRPIFEFVSSNIHPSDALSVFAFEDDYSFGILQSAMHWAWFTARCSTLTARFRYTSNTVFDSFPWPQAPTEKQCADVAEAGVALRTLRRKIAGEHLMSLREIYVFMEEGRGSIFSGACGGSHCSSPRSGRVWGEPQVPERIDPRPGLHLLKDAHAALDEAVRAAYGMAAQQDPLPYLLELNQDCANKEADGQTIVGPGLPPGISKNGFVTQDAVEPPML
ncbi:MAG: class I SAM-dependent DNA methyltransferase [Polyangiaceae bacterium]|nr:class I SAM-dependent DNA methyltransferase [Polyangiaceae bacterium]